MSSIPFHKINSCGNHFVLIESNPSSIKEPLDMLIKKICKSQIGVFSDGLIFLWKTNNTWQWKFYNNDASLASICGNAARGTARYLAQIHQIQNPRWIGEVGLIQSDTSKADEISVSWNIQENSLAIDNSLEEELWSLNDRGLAGYYLVNSGVPHLVLLNHDNWREADRMAIAPRLQQHASLQPESANITWVSLNNMEVVTYERGVFDETASCGSGAIAAFMSLEKYFKNANLPVPLEMSFKFPGGVLRVYRNSQKQLFLAGASEIVFKGEYFI